MARVHPDDLHRHIEALTRSLETGRQSTLRRGFDAWTACIAGSSFEAIRLGTARDELVLPYDCRC